MWEESQNGASILRLIDVKTTYDNVDGRAPYQKLSAELSEFFKRRGQRIVVTDLYVRYQVQTQTFIRSQGDKQTSRWKEAAERVSNSPKFRSIIRALATEHDYWCTGALAQNREKVPIWMSSVLVALVIAIFTSDVYLTSYFSMFFVFAKLL